MSRKVSKDFLNTVQSAGWTIVKVGSENVVGRCQNAGCGFKAVFQQGHGVPRVDPCRDRRSDLIPIDGWQDFISLVKRRRIEVGLSIRDVEDIAGLATDHLAKFEKDDPARMPTFQIAMETAAAAGIRIFAEYGPFTAYGLNILAETRDKVEERQHRAKLEEKRAAERRANLQKDVSRLESWVQAMAKAGPMDDLEAMAKAAMDGQSAPKDMTDPRQKSWISED